MTFIVSRPGRPRRVFNPMYLVAIAWIYVVLMMALAEALSPQGTLLGAVITFVLYGLLPLGIVLYIMATPARRRARRREQARAEAAEVANVTGSDSAPVTPAPDRGRHAPAAPIAPEREER